MNKSTLLRHLVSQPNEATFEQNKTRLVIRVLVVSSIIIFTLETLVMVLLEAYLYALPMLLATVLDGLTLIVFLLPINYFFIVRPMSRQIEEHHQTNQELRKSNEVLERFFTIGEVLIAYLDADFNFIRVNQAYSQSDERAPADFIGKNHFDLFPDAENRKIFSSVVRTGKPYYAIEKPFRYAEHPERGVTYWDWSLLPVKNPDGQVIALILALTNVTARKEAQMALAESERRFRAVFNQTFQQSAVLDAEGRVLLINQTALDFSGIDPTAVQGKPLWEIPWWAASVQADLQETREQIRAAVQQAHGGSIFRGEYRVRGVTGEAAIMDITIKPLLNEQGSPVVLIYEARDITTRIQAEDALKRSERESKRLYLAEIRARETAETLRGASLALSGSLNSETVIETLLDHLKIVVPYTSAHVLLIDDQDHLVVRLERVNEPAENEESLLGRRFAIDDLPFFHPLLVERELVHVPDTLLYPGAVFLPHNRSVLSWLGIPLMAGEHVIGACLLEHNCPGYFSEDRMHWATALTGQAAVAIQNAWLFEQVRDGRESLQALSRRLVEVQENERHYIARELHDEAGQGLASLMIGLRHLEQDSDKPATVISRSQELKKIADDVLENLHRLAIDLRPAALDHLGLVAALRQHAERFSDQSGLTVQFETLGKIERLPGEVETAVYRIVQEALTNVVRHARATRVDILIERRGTTLVVVVEDNGIGFDPEHQQMSHLGMVGMRERADMLGGRITFESAPGKGTSMLLEVPCQFEF